MKEISALLLLCSVTVSGQVDPRLGGVSGRITTPDGAPVVAATVGYLRLAPLNRAAGQKVITRSAADGSFALTGMAAGSYTICVYGPAGSTWLDPCLWSDNPPVINLLRGQTLTGQRIEVQKAATLEVRLSDPGNAVAANEGKTPNGHLDFGVWTGRRIFVRAHPRAGAGVVRSYEVPVPQGKPFQVGVLNRRYQLRGAGGAAITGSIVRDSLTVGLGSSRSTINVTVAGVAP